MSIKELQEIDVSTEERIKQAARIIFQKKGLAASRTRDIAEAADVNLALLNYYFRSKENLFEIIMLETIGDFANELMGVMNDKSTSFEYKIEQIVSHYLAVFAEQPQIPLFVLNEIRNHPEMLLDKMPIYKIFDNLSFYTQFQEKVALGEVKENRIVHYMINLLSLTIFPIIAQPMIKAMAGIDDTQFEEIMHERKDLIPIWMKEMMKEK